MSEKVFAEYIWLDGVKPTAQLRSKTKVLPAAVSKVEDLPKWSFDGSSTEQAEGAHSDCVLQPVAFVPDPIKGGSNILVLCEVFQNGGAVHSSNTRRALAEMVEKTKEQEPWFGIEQEYTLFKMTGGPLGFPDAGFPGPQGPYYCGVGSEFIFGREISEKHAAACLAAGLEIFGTNSEVMPGQWEFQIGTADPLTVADHLWIARWLLKRIAEDFHVIVSFLPKPVQGDWNGAGAHTNFSTKTTREDGGLEVIKAACEKLKAKHEEHIAVYGAGNELRLTGRHETCSIKEFRYGESDRGASIRIPIATTQAGKGYFEDRRPAANCDPYQVLTKIIETVCL